MPIFSLHRIAVAIVLHRVSDANLGTINLLKAAIHPISDNHFLNDLQIHQIQPPPWVHLSFSVSAVQINFINGSVCLEVKCR